MYILMEKGPAIANWTAVDIYKQYLENELYLVIKLEVSADIIYLLVKEITYSFMLKKPMLTMN